LGSIHRVWMSADDVTATQWDAYLTFVSEIPLNARYVRCIGDQGRDAEPENRQVGQLDERGAEDSGVNPCEAAPLELWLSCPQRNERPVPKASFSTRHSGTRRIETSSSDPLPRILTTKSSHAAAVACAWTRYHQNRPPMNRPTRS
jgi:hypothetical protein